MVLFITVWYIRQKGRRYSHSLWIVVPVVGQIALICLANHRTQKAVATASLSSAEAETAKENVKASRTKRSETTSPETVATTAERKTSRKKLLAVIGGVAALAVILIIALLIPEPDHVPSNGTSPPTQSTPDQPALQTTNQAGLSPQQIEIVDSFGWPHSFSIFEITDENNSAQRIDTWTYFDSGITLVFLNGEFLNTEPADQLPPGFIATPYTPNQFIMGASPDEVSSLAIGSEWVGMPGVDDLIEGGGLYVAQQLVTAFSENRLVFVEAVAIVPEGSN